MRSRTYGLPEILYVLFPDGYERNPRLRALGDGDSSSQSVKQKSKVSKSRSDSQSNHRHKYNKSGKGHAVVALHGKPSTELREDETGF